MTVFHKTQADFFQVVSYLVFDVGNTRPLIRKFSNQILGRTSARNEHMEIGLLISSLHGLNH